MISSIYKYYLRDVLLDLSKIPMKNQFKECLGLKIVVLDYCGIISKLIYKFSDYDIYLVNDQFEDVSKYIEEYDIVYVLANAAQSIYLSKPYLKVVCNRNRIERIEVSG